jgi:hypothetical protein
MNKAIHMLPAQRVEPSSARIGASVVASAVGGIVLALSGMPAQAALVTLCGNTICYEYNDDAGVNAGITLYGAPTLLANSDTLKFAPTAFEADSDPGTPAIPTPTQTATFLFSSVYAKNGTDEIGTIEISEDGDYQILGDASVSAELQVRVTDIVDNLPVVPTQGFPEEILDIQLFSSSTDTGLAFAPWSLGSMVSPATVFTDLASNVEVSIQNTLQAVSGSGGGYAYIAKKLLLTVSAATPPTNTEVPVPAAAWLFASGLGAMGWFRRRKSG